ncbi:4494_t:CDS:2, partial [Scutellospora calospora]
QNTEYVIGCLLGRFYSDFILRIETKKNNGIENRLSIIIPLVMMFIGGICFTIIGSLVSSYLINSFSSKSVSVIAILNFVKIAFSSIITLTAAKMQDTLEIVLMFTLLSVLVTLGCRCLVLVFIKEKRKDNLDEFNECILEQNERNRQIRYSVVPQ